MDKSDLIRLLEEARDALDVLSDWARELPSEYLDGDPDVRRAFRSDLASARELRVRLAAARAALSHSQEGNTDG